MNNIERAKLNILQRRQLAEKVSSDNLATLLAFADFKNIYREKRSLEIKFAKENFGGIDSAETAKQIKKLNIELLAIIHSHKMTAEDIAPKYFCDKCLDLGFVGKEQCVCLKNEIRQLLISDAQIKNANFVFENSTETDINNLKAYSFAEQFCNNFNKSKINNFLILGKNGAGKSFMASCIANRLIEQQISVMFVTAYNLNNIFLKSHLSPYNEKLADIDSIIDVDFLIIDDLGSETVYKNVTDEYLFNIINERKRLNKGTGITSNLTMKGLEARYDERLFSRIIDSQTTLLLGLLSKDKRLNFKN